VGGLRAASYSHIGAIAGQDSVGRITWRRGVIKRKIAESTATLRERNQESCAGYPGEMEVR
jgi:hypothetical protein